jgi:hypothetical protein
LTLEALTEFFGWLARPVSVRASGVFMLPGTAVAVQPATLLRKRAALATFYRFHARRDASVPVLLGALDRAEGDWAVRADAGSHPTGPARLGCLQPGADSLLA